MGIQEEQNCNKTCRKIFRQHVIYSAIMQNNIQSRLFKISAQEIVDLHGAALSVKYKFRKISHMNHFGEKNNFFHLTF